MSQARKELRPQDTNTQENQSSDTYKAFIERALRQAQRLQAESNAVTLEVETLADPIKGKGNL